jgi:hypothetical protein
MSGFVTAHGNFNFHLRSQTITGNDEFEAAYRIDHTGRACQINLCIWYWTAAGLTHRDA